MHKFEPYWDKETVAAGLSSGQLLLGQLRINPKNYTEAYINHPKGDADVFIPGTKARNRALNGDIVVVRLEPLKNWKVYDAFITKGGQGDQQAAVGGSATFVTVGEFLCRHPEAFRKLFMNISGGLKKDLDGFTDPSNIPGEPAPGLSSAARLPWWNLIQRVGRVVFIHRRLNCRVCVGFMRPSVSSSQSQKDDRQLQKQNQGPLPEWQFALLSPTDSRMPRIIIPKAACPKDFVRQPDTFKLVRFVAQIQDWPEDSIFAKGQLVRRFEDAVMNCIEAETDRILINVGFPYGVAGANTFPKAVEDYVLEQVEKLTAETQAECSRRRDFRSRCVITIDPRTARDLDDALHVRRLTDTEIAALSAKGAENAMYEVGVHIADVSYYVRPGDPVDVEAASRATSIYLVQLCVPMLPRALCENLCSLHPGTDKFTVSVVFNLSEDAQILTKWFGRTVIRSRAKLSYEDAQSFLDDPERDWQTSDFPTFAEGTDVKEICRSVLLLNELADKIRTRRFEGGSLQLNQVKPVFSVADDTGLPIGVSPFIIKQANRLIEEWMLAANEAVAVLLARWLPRTAFLRRHPPPTAKQIREAKSCLRSIGVDVDIRSAGAVQSSLYRLSGNPVTRGWQHSDRLAELCASMTDCTVKVDEATTASKEDHLADEAHMLATLNVLTKCMNLAEYYCLGAVSKTAYIRHYALNMEKYTHFTSPIRRYADVIVHRQLASILAVNSEKANCMDIANAYRSTCISEVLNKPDELAAIADYCNARKQDARRASDESAEVFFTVFVKECGPLTEACSVVSVFNHSFDVLLLSTGIVKRVYTNKLDLVTFEYEEPEKEYKSIAGTGVLHLQWNVRLSSKEESGTPLIPSDPAIQSAVPAATKSDHSADEPTEPPPCGCFQQKVKLFDLCRCLVAVDEGKTDSNESNRLPKLVVRILRPTCALCQAYVS
uniref:RNB domain-containing protein n=3 Tax=Mesocestoides corti TaxID=53468 RepID=A0A5K3FB24_MESCO